MSLPDTRERIEKSWNIRRALITKVLERGDTLVESLLLIPETGESITFERWKAVVVDELKEATDLFGNLLIHEAQQGCRDATYEPSRFPVAVPYPSPHRATPAYVVVTSSDLDTSRNKVSVSGLSWISRFGNGEPLLSESEIVALAAITNPRRGW